MAEQRLITRREFLPRIGVKKTKLYKDTAEGGVLHDAMIGDKLDLNHRAALVYCLEYDFIEDDGEPLSAKAKIQKRVANAQEKNRKPKPEAAPATPQSEDPTRYWPTPGGPSPEAAELIASEVLNMSIREVAYRFGTLSNFKDLVAVNKVLIQTRGIEDDQAIKRGDYVPTDQVLRLLASIDGLQKGLLTDATKNITNLAMAMTRADATRGEIEKAVRDVISRTIQATKSSAERSIQNAK